MDKALGCHSRLTRMLVSHATDLSVAALQQELPRPAPPDRAQRPSKPARAVGEIIRACSYASNLLLQPCNATNARSSAIKSRPTLIPQSPPRAAWRISLSRFSSRRRQPD